MRVRFISVDYSTHVVEANWFLADLDTYTVL